MFRDLTITGFRGFQNFSMTGLGRVNLLVGANNIGKTSVLEAIINLASKGDPIAILLVSHGRGELTPLDGSESRFTALEVAHLFNGHTVHIGQEFSIVGMDDETRFQLTAEVLQKVPEDREAPRLEQQLGLKRRLTGNRWLQLRYQQGSTKSEDGVLITPQGGWLVEDVQRAWDNFKEHPQDPLSTNVHFLSTASMSNSDVISALEKIILNPEEQTVLDALRIIEAGIEGIAPANFSKALLTSSDRAGVYVKLRGQERRIPIGNLGEGVWRLLGLSLALMECRNGTLSVDEIDTGLHYSVQVAMWKMVLATAKRLNVQVFATTHSRDCVEALAQIARSDVSEPGEVSLQRIERDRAVAYSAEAIVAAAERGVEVR